MSFAQDVIKAFLTIPNGSSVSNLATIPRNCSTVTVFTPPLLVVATNLTSGLPGLWEFENSFGSGTTPAADDVWNDLYAYDITRASGAQGGWDAMVQMAFPFVANQALVLPGWYFGSGLIRISTLNVAQVADATFTLFFSGFHN